MGFPSAQYSVRVVPFAPVEYLTYGIPPSPIFGGVMVPRERDRLFLGRFKGGCKGDRAPTRIQRSDSCGKRRNNGTDEACPPQAAGRMRNVEFVPTQLPLCRFLFTASGLFLCHQRKRGLNAAPPAQNFTAERHMFKQAFLKLFRSFAHGQIVRAVAAFTGLRKRV